jgi:hypothetical protein
VGNPNSREERSSDHSIAVSQSDAIPVEFPADLVTGSNVLHNSNLMISPSSPLAAQYGPYLGASELRHSRSAWVHEL